MPAQEEWRPRQEYNEDGSLLESIRGHIPASAEAQGSRAGLEAFFVTTDVAVEVLFKEFIKLRLFGMPGPVLPRRFGDEAAAGILAPNEARGDAATGQDRRADAGHGGLTSPGGRSRAALEI